LRENIKTMNKEESKKKEVVVILKYLVGILFLAFVGSLISLILLEITGVDMDDWQLLGFSSLYILWGIWLVILHLFLLNTEPIEYPQHKLTIWESRLSKVSELCGLVFWGFIQGLGVLVLIGMFLQWVLEINITEFCYSYRLVFIAWGVGIIGSHFYFKNQEEKKLNKKDGNENVDENIKK